MKITPELKLALSRILVARRNAAALTQDRLSEISGVPPRTIQRSERGDGISQENLQAIAAVYQVEAEVLLKEAAGAEGRGPGTRLSLPEIKAGDQLLRILTQAGSLQIGPEGEHAINEQIGTTLLELRDAAKAKSLAARAEARRLAGELLLFCREMGFGVFAGRHTEEHLPRTQRTPSNMIIAAADSDPRICRTAKGRALDFVMDERQHSIRALRSRAPTVYDWIEEQLVSRTDGDARVRFAMQRIRKNVGEKKD